MQKIILLIIIFILSAAPLLAQQDPDDPGIQDSIIIGSAYIDSGTTIASIPIYVETDDSVVFYHIAVSWESSIGAIIPRSDFFYYPPFNCSWDGGYDTVFADQKYIEYFGFSQLDSLDNCIYNTNGVRTLFTYLRLNIGPNVPRQLVVFEPYYSPRNLGNLFGLIDGLTEFTPAFQLGFLAIGPGVGVENEGQTPESFSLNQNYPNPFNPSTNIAFSLQEGDEISLVIYDLLGRRVRSLLERRLEVGIYLVTWNGRDDAGSNVPSGTYLYRLVAGGKSETKRMILIR